LGQQTVQQGGDIVAKAISEAEKAESGSKRKNGNGNKEDPIPL